jgi:DNA-binding NarL/FixJ family response regulator
MKSRAPDLVGVVEAAYDLAAADKIWIGALLDRVTPFVDGGFGVAAFTYDTGSPKRFRWSNLVTRGVTELHALALTTALGTMPRALVMRMLDAPVWATSASQVLGVAEFTGHPLTRALGHPHGMSDLLTVKVRGLDGRGLVFTAAQRRLCAVSRAGTRRWGMCAAHIAAAMRLRENVHREQLVEAVLEADGRVAHAEGQARESAARDALREAARAMNKARGAFRRVDADDALTVWQGLIEGRWSLVETIESDGRRYLVARRNDPYVPDPRALSPRERQVVAYVVCGHPLKLIAYELGLGPSTVAAHLRSAMRKLRARSRAELVQLVAAEELEGPSSEVARRR